MTTPKAHEQHTKQSEKVTEQKHESGNEPSHDGGAHDAGAAEPKGMPSSDRHQTETAKPE